MHCPNCLTGFFPHRTLPQGLPIEDYLCPICHGTGELPANIEYDPDRGQEVKRWRMDRNITLRDYCIPNGIDPVERSRNERGYFRREKDEPIRTKL